MVNLTVTQPKIVEKNNRTSFLARAAVPYREGPTITDGDIFVVPQRSILVALREYSASTRQWTGEAGSRTIFA